MVNYYNKYLKYKKKYLEIKKFTGCAERTDRQQKRGKRKETLTPYLIPKKDEPMEAEPDKFDIYYGLGENILAGMEFDLLSQEPKMVELELDRIKIVFWVNRKKISAECLDLSKVRMNNYLTAIKWIDTETLFKIFLENTEECVLAKKVGEMVDGGRGVYLGLESALRFYLELKYLIANIGIKQEKNMLRCKAYKEILMNSMLLKYYNDFCELIDLNPEKKLVGGQRLNSFILYLDKNYKENLDLELVRLFHENTEIRQLFQKILMLGHSDLDWNEKPRDKKDEILLASQLFNIVMLTLKDSLDDDEQVEYVGEEKWEETVDNFCSSVFSLDYTNENLKTIQFEKIESHTLTLEEVNQFQRILGRPLIFQLSEEADLKKIEEFLGLEGKNIFEEKIHIPQQEKKKLTRIFTKLVSSSLLHMHNGNLDSYFEMLKSLTINDFVSPICGNYLHFLIMKLNLLLEDVNKKNGIKIKLQGQKSPEKIRTIKAQKYKNGQLDFEQEGKEYNIPFAATATENNITLPIVRLEAWAEEAPPMSPLHSQDALPHSIFKV